MPTLDPEGNLLVMEGITPMRRRLKRGDIVEAKSPIKQGESICKRVIGLPGDVGTRLPWPFRSFLGEEVPRGYVWLEGDNHVNSRDSREYGPVPYLMVRARAFFCLWPPSSFGPL